jgi:hypothetical protein
MVRRIEITLLAGLAAASMAIAQSSPVQQAAAWERAKDTAPEKQTRGTTPAPSKTVADDPAKSSDSGVDEAVRWERAKDRAAKRQAQKESEARAASGSAKTKKQ